MTTQEDHISRSHAVGVVTSGLVAALCLVEFAAWWTHGAVPTLADVYPGTSRLMPPNGALAGLLSTVVVIGYWRNWPRIIPIGAASGALAIGVFTALEHVLHLESHELDTLLSISGGLDLPPTDQSRPTPVATVNMVLLGCALLLLAMRKLPGARQLLATAAGLIALVALFGHMLGVEEAQGFVVGAASRMSTDAASSQLLIAVSIITIAIEFGWTAIQVSPLSGGRVARALIPVVLVLSFATTVVVIQTLIGHDPETRLGLQVTVSVITIVMLAGTLLLAKRLDVVDAAREANLAGLAQRAKRSSDLRVMTGRLALAAAAGEPVPPIAVEMVVSGLPSANLCLFLELTGNQGARDHLALAGLHHLNPRAADMLRDLYAVPALLAQSPSAVVVATGKSTLVSGFTPERSRELADSRFWPLIDEFGIGSVASARVDVGGEPQGLIVVSSGADREISPSDLSYIEEVARVFGLALTAARFYEDLRQANRQLESRVVQRTAELEAARAELEAIVDRAADAIITVDGAGIIRRSNQAAYDMFRYPGGVMVGMPWSELRLSGIRDDVRPGLHQELMLRSDGGQFLTQTTVGEVAGTPERESLFLLVCRDITQQAEDAERLRLAEERFRSAFDHAPIGMALTGLDMRWLRVNEALSNIVGYSREELLEMDFKRITHPDDVSTDAEFLNQLLTGQIASFTREKRYIHKDSSEVWINLSVSVVRDHAGQPLYFIAQMEDVTRRRALLEQLNRSNEDLRRFAYVASHDLQAPLRTVGGFTEVLLRSLDPSQLTDSQKMYAGHIQSGVVRMQLLIRDLLSYGRIETSTGPTQAVELKAIFSEVIEDLANDITANQATVTLESSETLVGNSRQLSQLLQNLVSNSIVHHQPRAAPFVVVSARHDGALIEVAVADDGPGIAPEHRERIFEMFQQVHKSEGTGIGLSIAKRIVERHGGQIWVDPTVTTGTTIRFTLPGLPLPERSA